jgi:hypothetical protein
MVTVYDRGHYWEPLLLLLFLIKFDICFELFDISKLISNLSSKYFNQKIINLIKLHMYLQFNMETTQYMYGNYRTCNRYVILCKGYNDIYKSHLWNHYLTLPLKMLIIFLFKEIRIFVRKYQTYLYEKQVEKRALGKFFRHISQRVQINFIFTDNICILCLSCNVEKFKTNVKFD